MKIERNYFGSGHGKEECDSETAHFNMRLNQAILSRKVAIFWSKAYLQLPHIDRSEHNLPHYRYY